MSEDDKEILILGGGDGYVAETALKINPKLKISLKNIFFFANN